MSLFGKAILTEKNADKKLGFKEKNKFKEIFKNKKFEKESNGDDDDESLDPEVSQFDIVPYLLIGTAIGLIAIYFFEKKCNF